MLFDSIYIALLKWQSYKNGEKMSGSQGLLGDGGGWREVDVAVKGQQEGMLVGTWAFCILTVSTSTSWLWNQTVVL